MNCSTSVYWLALLVVFTLITACDNKPEESHTPPPAVKSKPSPAKPIIARRLLWGDTQVHSSWSMGAALLGNTLPPQAAYRFARGEVITSSNGVDVQLARPLDFLVVADTSDNLGFFPALRAGDNQLMTQASARRWRDMLKGDATRQREAAQDIVKTLLSGEFPDALKLMPTSALYQQQWQAMLRAADEANVPGEFSALIGYEWAALISPGNALHRVVIYRDGAKRAGEMMPFTTELPDGSPNPRDLWRWMQRYEDTTGGSILAIAHGGNASNGMMFPNRESFDGGAVNARYATLRARWEPLYEISQIKGDSETHPALSPGDVFADFGRWDAGNLNGTEAKQPWMLAHEYARSALGMGLELQQRVGVNPYQFGFVAATDAQTSLATADDNNFMGAFTPLEAGAHRLGAGFSSGESGRVEAWQQLASGYTAVWAEDNTREAIFDAMKRREVYATTGPRIALRFFGGWHYTVEDAQADDFAEAGYRKGVPMGGSLGMADGEGVPVFLIKAKRDADGAMLDAVQVVKVSLDATGATQEHIYTIDWPERGEGGGEQLQRWWRDPDFSPDKPAVYYLRVLEMPTDSWRLYDAQRFAVPLPDNMPASAQRIRQRAYSSPIWYTP